MIRKFNYTGRKRIPLKRISINVGTVERRKAFNAEIDFNGLEFPPEAKVYIEPYYRASYMRFDFGSIGTWDPPLICYLQDIPDTSLILFRVKIVDESENIGKLLGIADRIEPNSDEKKTPGKRTILPVDYDKDLKDQICRVNFDEVGNQVVLEINKRIENCTELVRTNEFKILVLPGIIRIIAERLKDYDYDENGSRWQDMWIKYFIRNLKVIKKPKSDDYNEDMIDDWINDVVLAFCRNYGIYRQFLNLNIFQR